MSADYIKKIEVIPETGWHLRDVVNLWIQETEVLHGSAKRKVLKELVWEEVEESYLPSFPCPLSLSGEEAQKLMDNLWDAGVRPYAAKGSAGQMEAVERHLKDMQEIAFHKLGINK